MAFWSQIVRRLGRSPVFTSIALVTLAIAIGANTAIFTLVDHVLLRPLSYPGSDRLIAVRYSAPGIGVKDLNIAPSHYFINREQSTTLDGIALYTRDAVNITGMGAPEHVTCVNTSDSLLPLLGVQPVVGRLFSAHDDAPDAPQTAILSYAYWQKRFGGTPSAIGSTITLDGKAAQVIGVLPRNFHFVDDEPLDMVLPLQLNRGKTFLGNYSFEGIARLKPGVSLAQAHADLARLIPIAWNSFSAPVGFGRALFEQTQLQPNLRLLKSDVIGDVGKVLWVLLAALGLVLLVACANVANLLLVRVEGRRQELAIRAALGASRSRQIADLLAEGILLAVAGGLIGLGLADAALHALRLAGPQALPRLQEIHLDAHSGLFTAALMLITGLLIVLVPMLKYAGPGATAGLREGGRTLSQSRERHRARKTLVIVQVATALVLLLCSGLMLRTFFALTHVEPGFQVHGGLETFRFYTPESQIPDAQGEQLVHQNQEILRQLSALPGVSSASFSTAIPLSGYSNNDVIYAQDHPLSAGKLPPTRRFKFVSPGYFATLGTQLLAGRDLTWSDTYEKRPVALISEDFARQYWGSATAALGKKIRIASSDDWREIVGVAENVREDGIDKPAPATVYYPVLLANFEGQKLSVHRSVSFALRSSRSGSQQFLREIEQRVWAINGNVPLSNPTTLDIMFHKSLARTSFTLALLSTAGGMALLLGLIGLYGVLSYTIAQRTREIGIRMALGAQRTEITALFVRQGLSLTLIGAAIGLAASCALLRLLSSLLYHVSPFDPLTYATMTAALLLIAALACYLPSRRAASIEPTEALRRE
jgi:predicted permease